MIAQVLFFNVFSEKDPHINTVEILNQNLNSTTNCYKRVNKSYKIGKKKENNILSNSFDDLK